MSNEAISAEIAATVNELRLSGRLLGDPELRRFQSGSQCIQTMLAVPTFNGKRSMQIYIKSWVNDTNMGMVEHVLSFHEGDNVVVTGSLNIMFSNGRTFVDCDITLGSITY